MKLISILCLLGVLGLSGCATSQFPNVSCAHWSHDGNYAFGTTHYEASGVSKAEDGTITIQTYSGGVKVLGGYGVSDTIQGLVIKPVDKTTTTEVKTSTEAPKFK